jgi:prolyl 4-hydroxylase
MRPEMSRSSPSAALDLWLRENLNRGCSPGQLLKSLLDAGYAPDFASALVLQADPGTGTLSRDPHIPRDPHMPRDPRIPRDPHIRHAQLKPEDPQASQGLNPHRLHAEHCGHPSLHAWWSRIDALADTRCVDLGDRVALMAARLVDHGIVFVRKVLAPDECDAIVEQSSPRIERSTVVDPVSGASVPDPRRTSHGTYFEAGANPLIGAVEARLARLSGLPQAHGEGLQILHYTVGGEYQPHFDYFDPSVSGSTLQLARGGQRIVTIIVYLNEVEGGGATIFPELGLEFLPEKGAALMFTSLTRDGRLQPLSLHGGAPVTAGTKWIATRWIRINPYD